MQGGKSRNSDWTLFTRNTENNPKPSLNGKLFLATREIDSVTWMSNATEVRRNFTHHFHFAETSKAILQLYEEKLPNYASDRSELRKNSSGDIFIAVPFKVLESRLWWLMKLQLFEKCDQASNNSQSCFYCKRRIKFLRPRFSESFNELDMKALKNEHKFSGNLFAHFPAPIWKQPEARKLSETVTSTKQENADFQILRRYIHSR